MTNGRDVKAIDFEVTFLSACVYLIGSFFVTFEDICSVFPISWYAVVSNPPPYFDKLLLLSENFKTCRINPTASILSAISQEIVEQWILAMVYFDSNTAPFE